MSGSKCVRYGVTHDGKGMSFAAANDRNEVLRQKILRLQAQIRDLVKSRAGLAPPPLRTAISVDAARRDVHEVVRGLNDNQAIYNESAAALTRLQAAADLYDAQASLAEANARAAELAVQIEAHLRAYPSDRLGAALTPAVAPPGVPPEMVVQISRKQQSAVASALAALEAAQQARQAGVEELARLRQARLASDAAAKAERARDADRLAAQLHPEASAASRARIETLAKVLATSGMQQARQEAESALRDALRRENAEAIRSAAEREEADLLLDQIACFNVSDDIRAALAAVSEGTFGPDAQQVFDLTRHELQEAKRAAVADRLTTAFRELGYQVEGNFHTLCARGGQVFAQSGGFEAGYALSINAQEERISFEMVRVGGAGEAASSPERDNRDIRAQQLFCDDFARIREWLGGDGVPTDIVSADAVGARPVTVVTTHPFGAGPVVTATPERTRTLPR